HVAYRGVRRRLQLSSKLSSNLCCSFFGSLLRQPQQFAQEASQFREQLAQWFQEGFQRLQRRLGHKSDCAFDRRNGGPNTFHKRRNAFETSRQDACSFAKLSKRAADFDNGVADSFSADQQNELNHEKTNRISRLVSDFRPGCVDHFRLEFLSLRL